MYTIRDTEGVFGMNAQTDEEMNSSPDAKKHKHNGN